MKVYYRAEFFNYGEIIPFATFRYITKVEDLPDGNGAIIYHSSVKITISDYDWYDIYEEK